MSLDHTHDPGAQSWVDSANDPACDFPIQNLPFGRFRRPGDEGWRIGVAIGDQVLDLRAAKLIDSDDMNRLMTIGVPFRQSLRQAIFNGLRHGSAHREEFERALLPQSGLELGLPCAIGDYTDFYTGIHHATTVGKLFRPDNPLLPNYKWVPIGYHGRASSIIASGSSIFAAACGANARARSRASSRSRAFSARSSSLNAARVRDQMSGPRSMNALSVPRLNSRSPGAGSSTPACSRTDRSSTWSPIATPMRGE